MDIFCKIVNGEIPGNKCFENDKLISIMDANPLRPGHILIIPKRHYTTILDMDADILKGVNDIAKMLIKKMEEVYPEFNGVQVVINYGEEQKVKHFHMHLIPTYEKGKTPTLSQDEFCNLLKK